MFQLNAFRENFLKLLKFANLTKRIFHMTMTNSAKRCHLMPPPEVRGMTVLNKENFDKVITVPVIECKVQSMKEICKLVKKYFLKLRNFTSVATLPDDADTRQLFLDPDAINEESIKELLKESEVEYKIGKEDIKVTYDDWPADLILESVLPADELKTSSFSLIGHIMHLNLREHLLPYRYLIGQVYFDKLKNVSLVVNKNHIIDESDDTFRTFKMEKLAGNVDDTNVQVAENGCTFSFDFAKVYWNPRLSTEHERILKKLNCYDILYDVMAGVGPFAIPAAAKKKCTVLANDLNPYSYEALKANCIKNKVGDNVQCFNLDGSEFIRTELKNHLESILKDEQNHRSIHVTMNLPSSSINFLPAFKYLFSEDFPKLHRDDFQDLLSYLPLIHIYLFTYIDLKEYAWYMIAEKLGLLTQTIANSEKKQEICADDLLACLDTCFTKHVTETHMVRKVSSSKFMYRVSFHLPQKILIEQKCTTESNTKKIKLS